MLNSGCVYLYVGVLTSHRCARVFQLAKAGTLGAKTLRIPYGGQCQSETCSRVSGGSESDADPDANAAFPYVPLKKKEPPQHETGQNP